jgi:oxygen-dependent protoporphyrinogen oxidase
VKIAVLGGGITGLTAAWRLSAAGHSVRLLEAAPRLGGAIRSESSGGWLVEAGPNSFLESAPEISTLFADLGLGPELVRSAPAAKNRYLALNGALVGAPMGPGGFFSTPLFSLRTKMGILMEIARRPRARPEDVSVAELISDHFGGEVLERAFQPFIGGVYAGDARRLSARYGFPKLWEAERTSGSIIRSAIAGARRRRARGLKGSAPIVSFRSGLQALPDALAARLPPGSVSLGAEVRSIAKGSGARWRVGWSGPAGDDAAEFDGVVSALPAWSLAALEIGAPGARPLAGLAEVEYSPVASVFLGFRRDQVRHPLDGFGALIPATEGSTTLGILFSSSLFAGRAPEGHVALTVFAGGALRPEVARLSEEELNKRLAADLQKYVGAQGKPVFSRRTYWPRAIAQYNLGYGRHLDAMAACERDHPGFLIGGSVRDGIALPDCILSGISLANRAGGPDRS